MDEALGCGSADSHLFPPASPGWGRGRVMETPGCALLITVTAYIHLGAGFLLFFSNNGLKRPDINGPDNLCFA